MSKISIEISGYTGNYASLNGVREMKVSRRAILTASLTVGFQHFGDLMSAPGRQRFHRILQGCSALNCMTRTNRGWSGHDFRNTLDGSEKSPLSYWQGMIFAKLVAAEILSVPWLANVDDLKAKGTVETEDDTEERGDLVGRCKQSRWHVIEAKGRSHPYSSDLIKKAKQQAARITSVSGESPVTHSACVTSLWEDPIKVVLVDPPPQGEESLDFSDEFFWKSYYGGLGGYIREFRELTKLTKAFPGYTFASLRHLFVDLPDEKILELSPLPSDIGLPDAILDNPATAPKVIAKAIEDGLSIDGDGVLLVGPFGNLKKLERKP